MSQPPVASSLDQKRDALLECLRSYGRVAVAFSGGVDSALVAKAAALACGEQAIAVTAKSPSLASGELELAASIAQQIGIRHVVIGTDEFATPEYQRNAGDRCYYCKNELYTQVAQRREELLIDIICNGANLDDTGDHRPGMKAARDHSVRSPLIEAGLNKEDVRALAKYWNLSVWDKPAMPCLSSRIAYGVEVTPERVQRIDRAEAFLKIEFSLTVLRVRCEANDLARIEVPLEEIPRITDSNARENIVNTLKDIGFKKVTIDLEGFRSGNLNESLPVVALQIPQDASKFE